MPEMDRTFYGKRYRLQFQRDMPEKEAKQFLKDHENMMRVHLVKSNFKNKLYPNTNYYYIYARSKLRDARGLP